MRGHVVLTSCARLDWATPRWLFDLLDAEFHFELDAAASAENAKCLLYWNEEDDALVQSWIGIFPKLGIPELTGVRSVFCNPPYGRGIGAWMAKAKTQALLGGTVVMLVPARPDTDWWARHVVDGATEVRFLKGRIQFEGAESGATFPSAVVIYTATPPVNGPRYVAWDPKVEAQKRGMTVAKRKAPSTKKKTGEVSINETTEAATETIETPAAVEMAPSLASDSDPFGFGAPAASPALSNGNGHPIGTNLLGTPVGLFTPGAAAPTPPVAASAGIRAMPVATKVEPANLLKANLKGMSGDVVLAPLMAVCGGNRRGKTALRVAFEMALTGVAPGCVHAADYMEYAPIDADGVSSMLIGPNGSAHYEVLSGKKPPDRPEYFGAFKVLESDEARLRVLPSTTMKSFLVGDVKARRAIFQRFGHGVVAQGIPIPNGLNTEQAASWTSTVADISAKANDLSEVLSEANRVLASRKLALGKEATAAEKQLKEAKAQLAQSAAGAELIPELEEQYKKAVAYENLETTRRQLQLAESEYTQVEAQAQEFLQKNETITKWEASVAQFNEAILQGVNERTVARGALSTEAAGIAPRLKRVSALDEILGAMIQAGTTTFPALDVIVDPAALRAKISALLTERGAEHEQIQAKIRILDSEIAGLQEQSRTNKADFDRAKNEHEGNRMALKSRGATVQARIQALQQALASAPSVLAESSEAIKAKIETLRGAENVRVLVTQLETAVRQKRNEQATAKTLEGEAEALLQSLLEQASTGAEAAVNRYMPAGFAAKLDLSSGGCEWRVIGSDNRAHNKHTMSGAERSSLLVALALAWTEGAPVRVLTLDDEDLGPYHSSPENLQALLAKVKEAVESGALTQAMVCGVRADEVPAGWLVIQR